MHLWDRLLFQAVLTLNLLRPSRLNPKLSAHDFLHGPFNYMSTPIAPPGTKVEMHLKPGNRPSFGYHSQSGWYVGPAMQHYRCYKIYVPSTSSERIADTVEFFPTRLKMPASSALDKATQAVEDLLTTLRNPEPSSPFFEFGNEQRNALNKLANLFKVSLPTVSPTADTSTTPPRPLPRVPLAPSLQHPASLPRVQRTQLQSDLQSLPSVEQHEPTQPSQAQPPPHNYDTRLQRQLRQRHQQINHAIAVVQHWAAPVLDEKTGKLMEYRDLIKSKDKIVWERGFSNEIGRLAQGIGTRMPHGTNTIKFVSIRDIPKNKTITYARIVSELRPQKDDPFRIRITAGGNLIFYPDDKSQPTSDIVTAKILLNSVVSTPNAKFLCLDIKNMYLNSELPTPEYMRIPIHLIPQEVMDQYNLSGMIHNGYVYCEINRGLYGLPQAGKLAHDKLKKHLIKFDFYPCKATPGLWRHKTRDITFCLVVDDFGVKYVNKNDANFLISCLKEEYQLHEDWEGTLYIGMTLNWDYHNRTVELSMPNYIKDALIRFCHPLPATPQHSPFAWTRPQYGAKIQLAPEADRTTFLNTKDTTRIQQIVGTLLYYGRAIDNTILPALNDIAANQSKPTQTTAQQITRLLDYCASHPDASIMYNASDMILHVHSDASYLSAPKARSKVGGFFFLSSRPVNVKHPENSPTPLNGPVHIVSKRLRNVVASAAEAETGALFYNGQEAIPLIRALIEMGHDQPPTPIQTDNTTACGIVNSSIRQRRSKAMEMRFYWIQDKCNEGQFVIYWKPGINNLGDYFTKHHSTPHHKEMRSVYLHAGSCLSLPHTSTTPTYLSKATCTPIHSAWQGCVGPEITPQPNRARVCHIGQRSSLTSLGDQKPTPQTYLNLIN